MKHPPQCPACQSSTSLDLLDIPEVPVYCNVLWPQREQAVGAARGTMNLKYCNDCAHVFNASYDEALTVYTPAYDNSLHFSPHFNQYARDLAARLIERYSLRGKKLVEVGCGKGDFLMMLCEQGDNLGWGFDRSFDPQRVDAQDSRLNFVQDFYTPQHAARLRPDFVCLRHVLEHIADPTAFLSLLRPDLAVSGGGVFYVEVPNALFTLRDLGIWDLIYEHCSYFTLTSLTHAAIRSGFDVLSQGESFGGQFIYVEMRPGSGRLQLPVPREHAPSVVGAYANTFASQYRQKVREWKQRQYDMRSQRRVTVAWGGGSKGVTFLNALGADCGIEFVVDLNPKKHGKYIAGTGQRVVGPEFLRDLRPSDVIVMNPIYLNEISGLIRNLGVNANLFTL